MGGADTEVDENTKNIILEAATFVCIPSAKRHEITAYSTDAVTRFNKGQSPLQNDRVLAEAMRMVNEFAKGNQASNVADHKDGTVKTMPLVTASAELHQRPSWLKLPLTKCRLYSKMSNVCNFRRLERLTQLSDGSGRH